MSEVDKTIAEKVMGWQIGRENDEWSQPHPAWGESGLTDWDYCCMVSDYSPSTNPAQFDEAFRKADENLRFESVRRWAATTLPGSWPHEWHGWIATWQLAPLTDKAKALAEAVLKGEK